MRDWRQGRLVASAAAIVGTELFSSFYDDLLYPLAIATLGPLYGGVGVSVAALIINYLMVMWYRRTETDWYFFEAARSADLEEMANSGSKKIGQSRVWTFINLAVLDPFLAFAYYEGRKTDIRFDRRDWLVFLVANAIGIGCWLFVLLVLFAAGGAISEEAADWVMYAFGAYGLYRVFQGWRKHRVTAR